MTMGVRGQLQISGRRVNQRASIGRERELNPQLLLTFHIQPSYSHWSAFHIYNWLLVTSFSASSLSSVSAKRIDLCPVYRSWLSRLIPLSRQVRRVSRHTNGHLWRHLALLCSIFTLTPISLNMTFINSLGFSC